MNKQPVTTVKLQYIVALVEALEMVQPGSGIEKFRKAVAQVKLLRAGALQEAADQTGVSLR
ncbi:MAG: hypothetical protein HRU33_11585 [Rhodobacteraceae bacterium]|nr:hypothetical protein [Paracoccaceae bacterium]